jgi:N-acetylmuramic acid 6-phosphate etherase
MNRITESESLYNDLDRMTTSELLLSINQEDQKVALLVQSKLPQIEKLVDAVYQQMKDGGRLFYIGAGTSGRLGIVDASECPPTYGVPHGMVIGIIAGGDSAIRKAVEFAEDNIIGGWDDLQKHKVNQNDVVIGIAASGTTPYVFGALDKCRENNIVTGSITCNSNSPVAKHADFPIEVIVGPEFVTGSTRMKAGTAQKLVLNMISSAVMIKLGRVKDNKMVDMQMANNKLVERGVKLLQQEKPISVEEAKTLLKRFGSVREALLNIDKT